VERDIKLNENCEIFYSLILGQCTEYMRAKLESLNDYEKMKDTFDVITLIISINRLTCQFEGQQYHTHATHQAKKRLYLLYQAK
jgi:hypothetical protein